MHCEQPLPRPLFSDPAFALSGLITHGNNPYNPNNPNNSSITSTSTSSLSLSTAGGGSNSWKDSALGQIYQQSKELYTHKSKTSLIDIPVSIYLKIIRAIRAIRVIRAIMRAYVHKDTRDLPVGNRNN